MKAAEGMSKQGAGSRFSWVCFGLLLLVPLSGWAQTDSESGAAAADSLAERSSTAGGDSLQDVAQSAQEQGYGGDDSEEDEGVFFQSFEQTPKAGARANVRQNTYYGELESKLNMKSRASLTNTAKWSFEEYRKQNKNVEKRSDSFTYNPGQALPLTMSLSGSWNWKQDETVNTAGFANLFAQDTKNLRFNARKSRLKAGVFTHSFRVGASLDDKLSVNQNTPNNSNDASLNGGVQTGWTISPGLVLAGRVAGSTNKGEKTLGAKGSPSSAQSDSLGFGIYYNQSFATGRVAIARANFRRKFLDFNKNTTGQIDTVGIAENLKIVDELETKDAMLLEFENTMNLGLMTLKSTLSRTTDDLNYAVNGQGLKERQVDDVKLESGFRVGTDSLTISYDYTWKWDDQRIRGATANRGRQYSKDRDLELTWQRPLFQKTSFRLRYFQGLSQDIAQFEHNQNDKDRLQNDFSMQLERSWPETIRARMVYTYRQSKDLSIRGTKSSNNNIKDSYEINPSYTFFVAPWLTWDQDFRVFIQFTDYIYSDLESVSREDNYNKRGNLTTKVTLDPISRVQIVLRHDYNKKFNATKSSTSAGGDVFYDRDLNQTISKLDLGLSFDIAPGVSLDTATYRTRDDRETLGRTTTENTEYSGELWVGVNVNKTWREAITLSALVKKYNAFGPSVTATSANYWEADVWLKWEF